jgi:uncharacterized protein YjbI with pentapeptide repeats
MEMNIILLNNIFTKDDITQIILIILGLVSAIGVGVSIGYGGTKYKIEKNEIEAKRLENAIRSFENLVAQLTSENKTKQLAAAVLLRNYFEKDVSTTISNTKHNTRNNNNDKKRIAHSKTTNQKQTSKTTNQEKITKDQAINVITALLRVLPTGVFQKTLADGLAFAKDLSNCDLQKTNLQDAFLDNKDGTLFMEHTDLFLADLSYANLTGINAKGIILYRANLFHASIKNCDFTEANFRNADFAGVKFTDCIFDGADFTGAINLPEELRKIIDENKGYFPTIKPENDNNTFSFQHKSKGKAIFFSIPGVLKNDELVITKEYKELMEKKGYNVIYYVPDKYPGFGQFDKVKEDISASTAMIVFGFKQVHVEKGTCRPNTEDERSFDGKWFPTSWNDIECGMGLMKGLPILQIVDPDIDNGVFDQKLSECFVLRLSTNENVREIEHNSVFREWLSRFE